MSDFGKTVTEIFQGQARLKQLMCLEKRRRGLDTDTLVFVGMANVAEHWWCTQQAVMKSRKNELEFFGSYLRDRLDYAHELGIIESLPKKRAALLDVGKEITLADVDKLLKKRTEEKQARLGGGSIASRWLFEEKIDRKGGRVRIINPNLHPLEFETCMEEAEKAGVQIVDLESDPLLRGQLYEMDRAEKYPAIRWNFQWGRYVVVCIPDGLTKDFSYEFKTTRDQFLLGFRKPVAMTQADLYGYFFRRPNKRVQILVVEEDTIATFQEPVGLERAEETLAAFARVAEGGPPRPPVSWKCNPCQYRQSCPISQAKW